MSDLARGRVRERPILPPESEANLKEFGFGAEVGLRQYLEPVLEYWRLIAICMIVAMGATALVSKLMLAKWYRATAVLKPVQGLASLGSGTVEQLSGVTGSLLGQLAAGGRAQQDAYTYITMLTSFGFTYEMIKEYRLEPIILPSLDRSRPATPWREYQALKKRFDTEYDFRTGNITLQFADPDPAQAALILGHYVDRLRDKLRNQEIDQAGAAVASLQREAGRTSDALLQDKLYELIAGQLQRKLVAQVQADFAFIVLEPSVVPDDPYWPSTTVNCLAAGSVTVALLALSILVATRLRASAHGQTEGDGAPSGRKTPPRHSEI